MRGRRAAPSACAALIFVVGAVAIAACDCAGSGDSSVAQSSAAVGGALPDSYKYTPPPRVRSYPSSYPTIQAWINTGNTKAIRAHGWDIWQSINTATPYQRPAWQTWYSGHELFAAAGVVGMVARPRNGMIRFAVPRGQTGPAAGSPDRTGPIPFDPAERVFAFNRFTLSTAVYIWKAGFNDAQTLLDTNNALTRNNVPLANRGILVSRDSTDPASFVLKPVYQFISGTQVTAVPYWAGDRSAFTTDSANPIPMTWRQAVAVDPTGKLQPGDSVLMPVNKEPARWLRVVPLSAFYWIRITKEDSAHFTRFGAVNNDFIGASNDTSTDSVYKMVRTGNIGLMMAMHVTGKEIPNWTWQSFWWAYDPNDPQFGADRPRTIPAPWNHYDMTVAYSMMMPNGDSLIAYNPYLETSLFGEIPNGPNPKDSLHWTGVTTNCMSCHRRAAIAYTAIGDTLIPPPYGNDMNIEPGDTVVFTQPDGKVRVPVLKTDFLWSVALRPKFRRAKATAPTARH